MTSGEFFVILDADFVPAPDFLYQTVPFFAEPNIAFVQTPQAYGNLNNLISRGAGYMQSVFYRFIQPGKNRFNAAFCVGTNVIYRRAAIEQIGGMYTDSKSEDVWTSLKLHEYGWKSTYISTVLAIGDTPDTIEAYTKQQLRWATGGFEILFKSNPFSRKLKLTLDQRLQYFGTATFYLMGVAPGLLLLVPPLQIYFGLAPINSGVSFGTWLMYYLGFYFMQVVVALYTIGSFRWETLMLATAVLPDLRAGAGQRRLQQGSEVARHRLDEEKAVAVQLHHPSADGLRLPGDHLGGRDLAGRRRSAASPWPGLEPAEHLDPGPVHGRSRDRASRGGNRRAARELRAEPTAAAPQRAPLARSTVCRRRHAEPVPSRRPPPGKKFSYDLDQPLPPVRRPARRARPRGRAHHRLQPPPDPGPEPDRHDRHRRLRRGRRLRRHRAEAVRRGERLGLRRRQAVHHAERRTCSRTVAEQGRR